MRSGTMMALALLGAAACSDGGGGGGAVDAGGDAPDGVAMPMLRGSIRVLEETLVYDDGGTPRVQRYGTAGAAFVTGRLPRWHQEVMRSNDCVLRRYVPSLCEPACDDGLCIATDVCEPFPTYQSAGAMTVTGLAQALSMAGTDGFYQPEAPLPEELFADGATVTATLAGGAFPAHAVTAGGVPAIAAAIVDGKITLAPGRDHVLRWTPADDGSRVQVTLNANNRGHGAPYEAIIECDAPDDAGQVTIPAAQVDGFPETAAWEVCAGSDCPRSTIRRYRRGTTAVGDAEVELVVGSQLNFGVIHDLPGS